LSPATRSATIGHYEYARQRVVLDCLREAKPPFSPEQVTGEFAQVLKSYAVTKIIGDKYAGGFPPEQFRKFSIRYDQAAKPRGELYIDLLPLINSRRIDLLDHTKLVNQLCSLERPSPSAEVATGAVAGSWSTSPTPSMRISCGPSLGL
jgi:hypothetical protein